MAHEVYPNRETYFGGENWSDEWPVEAEAGCLAACFADWKATDSAAKVAGLGHAYLSVAANEGIQIFNLLLLFGASLGGLSIWLTVHVVRTEQLVFIIPLVLTSVLSIYCWVFVGLKYRLRRLFFEVILFCCHWPFATLRKLALLVFRIASKVYRVPRGMMAGRFIVRPSRYRRHFKGVDTAVLCFACRRLAHKSRLLTGSSAPLPLVKATENWQHHSMRGLQESASHCHLCRLLLQSASAQFSTDSAKNEDGLKTLEKEHKESLTVLQEKNTTVRIWQEKSSAGNSSLKMQLQGGDVKDARPLEILEVPDEEENFTMGDWPFSIHHTYSAWDLSRRWIENCQHHQLCQNEFLADQKAAFLPKRLLEIAPGFPTGDKWSEKENGIPSTSLRLVETIDCNWTHKSKLRPYVALSHFFGDIAEESVTTHLTATNMEKLKTTIPLDIIPMIFRHAVAITANIGISYLWIDSLCVLQDSEEDQASEFSQRGLVFSNATCTVSTSELSSTGCLSTKPPSYIDRDCKILYDRDRHTGLVVRSHNCHDRSTEIEKLFKQHVDSQALTRWSLTSFQDRLLSRRILHLCGNGGVLFECNTMRASDHPNHQTGVPYVSAFSSRSQTFKPIVPGSVGPTCPGKIYGYHTRKKTVDRKSGAFKFETLVLTRDNQPVVQDQLEELRATAVWRRHRGSFQRLLRPTRDWNVRANSYPTRYQNSESFDRLALHNAWFDLVKAYSCSSSFINRGDSDRSRKKLLGVNGIAEFVARFHRQDNFQQVLGPYVSGLWQEMMPYNLLWYRANPALVSSPKRVDCKYFAQYPGPILHYQAPPGSLDARDRASSDFKTPTWSWASVDGQISHRLPSGLVKVDKMDGTVARATCLLKGLLQIGKPNQAKERKTGWTAIGELIDRRVELYDHWTLVMPDMSSNNGAIILPAQFSNLKLRIRNYYPVFNIASPMWNSEGVHVFYDSIDRLHQAVYPGHDVPAEVADEEAPASGGTITRAVFGLPILELHNNDPISGHFSERQLHGLALRHVRTVDGRGDIYKRVGYFCTENMKVIQRVLVRNVFGGVVWIQ